MAAYLVDHPDDSAMRRMAGQVFNSGPQATPSTAQSTASQQQGQGNTERPASGVAPVRYPDLSNNNTGQPSILLTYEFDGCAPRS